MNISDLMSSDHCRLSKMLDEFKNSIGSDGQKSNFHDFRWELEKHLFIEEKAIFTFAHPEDKDDFKAIPELEREHDIILDFLDKIERGINEGKNQEAREYVEGMSDFLAKHRKFEDSEIYPKLDVELSEEQKKIITKRIMDLNSN